MKDVTRVNRTRRNKQSAPWQCSSEEGKVNKKEARKGQFSKKTIKAIGLPCIGESPMTEGGVEQSGERSSSYNIKQSSTVKTAGELNTTLIEKL